MDAWELPPDVHALVLQKIIDDLEIKPLNGMRSMAPVVFQIHHISVRVPKSSEVLEFKLWVNETMKPTARRILEIQQLGDPLLLSMTPLPTKPGKPPFKIE